MRNIESMATQLARWTKAGRWENSVIVEASPDSDGWRNRVTLFMPGERTTINYQLRKRAQLDSCWEEDGQGDKERSYEDKKHNRQTILFQSNVRSAVTNRMHAHK